MFVMMFLLDCIMGVTLFVSEATDEDRDLVLVLVVVLVVVLVLGLSTPISIERSEVLGGSPLAVRFFENVVSLSSSWNSLL